MAATPPLTGVRLGVTGARKGPELCAAIERRGGVALHGPTIEPDQPTPDDELLPELDALLAAPPDWFVANTGTGMRLLAACANRHGRGDAFRALLHDPAVTVVARGAKAVGGLRVLAVRPDAVSTDETDASVTDLLAGRVAAGDGLAVQYSARTRDDYRHLADERGATLQVLRPYRSGVPRDDRAALALVGAAVDGALDGIVCTSAIAVDNLVVVAERHGRLGVLLDALQTRVAAVSIGAVTSAAFAAHGVPTAVRPERHRTGDLLRALERWAAEGRPLPAVTTGASR